MEEVLQIVHVTREELASLPDALIEEACDGAKLAIADKARVLLEIRGLRGRQKGDVEKYLENNDQQRLYPYKREIQLSVDRFNAAADTSLREVEDLYRELARAKHLTPAQVLWVNLLLDEKPLRCARLVLESSKDLTKIYNSVYALSQGDSWVARHGAKVLKLKVPLFKDISFSYLNEISLAAVDEEDVVGGGHDEIFGAGFSLAGLPQDRSSAGQVFRTRQVATRHTFYDEVYGGGGYTLAVDPSGRVDLTEVETAFLALKGEVEKLRAIVRRPRTQQTRGLGYGRSQGNGRAQGWRPRYGGEHPAPAPSTKNE